MNHFTSVTDISTLAPDYPMVAALRLQKVLKQQATVALPTSIRRGKRCYHFIIAGVPQLYLITEGLHYARRRSDHKIVGTFLPPVLLGWSGNERPPHGHSLYLDDIYLERRDSGIMHSLPVLEAFRLVQEAGLMADVVSLLSFHINHLLTMGADVVDIRAQEVVIKMLRRLMNFPPELRREFSVVKFIEERCMLSRSTIMRELGCLRHQGVLEMTKGSLVSFLLDNR